MSDEARQRSAGDAAGTGFGGCWLPEAFTPALQGIADGYRRIVRKRSFRRRLQDELEHYAGRPTSLFVAARLSARVGGARILCKREDHLETGSRHLTVALGQALLARSQGRSRVVSASATGAGAVAVAAAAVRFGLTATIFGGVEDLRVRERAFSRAETMGAEIVPVDLGSGGVGEALQVAFAEWRMDSSRSNLVLTAPIGPDPFPALVAELEAIVGRELALQLRKRRGKNVPDVVVAPLVGGGTIGSFSPWAETTGVRLIGTASAPSGPRDGAWRRPTVVHGARTLVLPAPEADYDGRSDRAQRYRALSPRLARWIETGRVGAALIAERAARSACRMLAESEGLLVSVQSGEVIAEACERASRLSDQEIVVAVLSGRGNDDIGELSAPLVALELAGPVRDYPISADEESV